MAFGEVVIDVYPDEEVVAGAPLHVSAHLALDGWKSYLLTRLGSDGDGARVREIVRSHGIDSALIETDTVLPTGRTKIRFADGENHFDVQGPAAWDAIEGPEELPEHEVFCYGTLAARHERSRAALLRLLRSSRASIKALDMNLRPPDTDRHVIRTMLREATLVKVTEQELEEVGDMLGAGPRASAVFDAGPRVRWVCITRGAHGARLQTRDGSTWSIEPATTEVVNTVGAGDAFIAGLVRGLGEGSSEPEALLCGQRSAASILARSGGLPDPAG